MPRKEVVESTNDPNSKRPRAPSKFAIPVKKKQQKRKISSSSEDDPLSQPRTSTKTSPSFKRTATNRKIVKPSKPSNNENAITNSASQSINDNEIGQRMDDLIKAQTLKFKPAKKKKRLNSGKNKDLLKIKANPSTSKEPTVPQDTVEESLKELFEPTDPIARALAQAEIDPEGNTLLITNDFFQQGDERQMTNEYIPTKTGQL